MIYIQPFESIDGRTFDWHGDSFDDYRWGALAVRLGRHWDKQDGSDDVGADWYDDLEEIEDELCAYASEKMGEEVRLAHEYI